MRNLRRIATTYASAACYRNSFNLTLLLWQTHNRKFLIYTSHRILYGSINHSGIGKACKRVKEEKRCTVLVARPEKKEMDWKICCRKMEGFFEIIFKEIWSVSVVSPFVSESDQVEEPCMHNNEQMGPLQGRNSVDKLCNYQLLKWTLHCWFSSLADLLVIRLICRVSQYLTCNYMWLMYRLPRWPEILLTTSIVTGNITNIR